MRRDAFASRSPFAPDASALTDEYNRAYKQAKEILKDVGAGGTSIDIDDMVANLGEGYQARPWENDAFFCGEIAAEYWSNDHAPDGLVGNQCSRQYTLAHNGRERYCPAGN